MAFPELSVLEDLLEQRQNRDCPSEPLAALLQIAARPAPAPSAAEPPLGDMPGDPAIINTLLQLIKTQSEQAQGQQLPPRPAAPVPLPVQGHLLQQYFGSAPLPAPWSAHQRSFAEHMQTAVSAPPIVGAGGLPIAANYNAVAANLQQEYSNLLKRQRLGHETSFNPYAPSHSTGGGGPEKRCSNCGANNTPFWRKDRNSKLSLCNACGLYAAKNDHPRPFRLWKEGQNVDHLIAAEAAAAAAATGQQQQQQLPPQQQQPQQVEGQTAPPIAGNDPATTTNGGEAEGLNAVATTVAQAAGGGADGKGDSPAAVAAAAAAAAAAEALIEKTTSDQLEDAMKK